MKTYYHYKRVAGPVGYKYANKDEIILDTPIKKAKCSEIFYYRSSDVCGGSNWHENRKNIKGWMNSGSMHPNHFKLVKTLSAEEFYKTLFLDFI